MFLPGSQEMIMKPVDPRDSKATTLYGSTGDELFLSQSAQRVVDKVVNIQLQNTPLVTTNHGSSRWGPSPDFRLGGCAD